MFNTSNKKYKLTHQTKKVDGHTLYQIKALKSFGDVKKGDLGGWIEGYDNLSQSDTAWVYNNAKVYEDALVCDKAKAYGNAKVYGFAWVCDNAVVYDNAHVSGYAVVCDNATIYGYNRVCCGVFGSGVDVVANGWGYLKNV